jgi:hypothetical protein
MTARPTLTAAQKYVLRLLNEPGKIAAYNGSTGDWVIDGKIFSSSVRALLDMGLAEEYYGSAIVSKSGRALLTETGL